jgi:hypothetical protein
MIFNENEKIVFKNKCFHQGKCYKNLSCLLKNPDPNTRKAVNYIDQCCCINFPCINSYGFTSDPFKDKHEGSHLLFAGCSYTHGSGVSKEEIWAHIVYEKISKEKECSGFFNIGFPGTSIQEQSFMILKYIEKFGKPETIFWLMPPTNRGFSNFQGNDIIEMENSKARNSEIDNKINDMYSELIGSEHPSYYIELNEFSSYIAYYNIYSYCKTNNIKLYSFSWQQEKKNKDLKSIFYDLSKIKNFDTFYMWETEKLIQFCEEFSKNYTGEHKEFLQIGRDKSHLGIAPHEFWADFIYNKYKEDK